MKQTSNNYLFSNFNDGLANYSTNKSTLNISNIYNLTTENNVIEPLNNFTDFFEKILDKSSLTTLKTNSAEIYKTIIYATIYDYYDSAQNSVISRTFAIDSNFNLYELDNEALNFKNLNLQFSSFPNILNNNGKLYLYSFNDLFIMIDESHYPLVITTPPNIISIIDYHNLKVFSILEYKFSIFVADVSDIVNIELDTSNYLEIKLCPEYGAVKKIIVYKNNIYAIQQYSISKIVLNDDDYSVSNFCSIKSEIFSDTVSLIDDFVIFYTTSGLYVFDGNDIKQVFKTISKNITGNTFKSVVFNNKYYLQTKFYINNITESVLLQFDIENDYCTIYKFGNIINIYIIQNLQNYKLNATIKNEDETYSILTLDNQLICQNKKYIKFNKITFDEKPLKVLSELKIQSIGKYKFSIHTEFQSVYYDISDNTYITNIGLKGQTFEIEIESDNSFMIESIFIKTISYSEG